MKYQDPLVVREAVADDLDGVEHCTYAAYQRYVGRMSKPPAPLLYDHAYLIHKGRVRVATVGDEVIAVLAFKYQGDHLRIDSMAVLPGHQGRGVGEALLSEANRLALGHGCDSIRLYTNQAMTENLAWYPRHGFVETHRATDDGYRRAYFSRPVRRSDGSAMERPSRLAPRPDESVRHTTG